MKKILIVDDEEVIRMIIDRILQATEYEVHQAKDGMEALDKHREAGYALMIVDLNMPRMDGQTLIANIRQFDQSLAFIILTAHGDLEIAKSLLIQFQVSDFLQKPPEIAHPFGSFCVSCEAAVGLAAKQLLD